MNEKISEDKTKEMMDPFMAYKFLEGLYFAKRFGTLKDEIASKLIPDVEELNKKLTRLAVMISDANREKRKPKK